MKTIRARIVISSVILGVLALLLPLFASAEVSRFSPRDTMSRFTMQLETMKMQLCEGLTSAIGRGIRFSKPAFCGPETPPPPPPPVDVCPNVPDTQESGPCADETCVSEGGTWNDESCDMPPPPPVDVCPNVSGNQEEGPCADVECIEGGGTWNGEECIPPPPPEEDILINEVAWMGSLVDEAADANAEWIELRNAGDTDVDVTGWTLSAEDGSPSFILSDAICESTVIPATGYLLLIRGNASIYDVPADCTYPGGVGVNALENGGETLSLRDDSATVVDTVDAEAVWPAGDNTTKETMQRTLTGEWETWPPTPGSDNAPPLSN